MTEPIRYESLVPPRDEEERELMDPESWGLGEYAGRRAGTECWRNPRGALHA